MREDSLVEIQLKRYKSKAIHSFVYLAMHFAILWYRMRFCSLRLATDYSWCLLNKPVHISKADIKIFIGGFQAKMREDSLVEIQLKRYKIKGHSFICIPCNAFCYLVIPYAILQYFVWLLTIFVLTVLTTLYANNLWTHTKSMPTALMAYAQIANDCSRHLCK